MRAKIVRIDQGIAVHTNYSEEFKNELKQLVPGRHRRWEDVAERWIIRGEYEEKVARLCVLHFGSVEVFGEDGDVDQVYDRAGRSVQERLL